MAVLADLGLKATRDVAVCLIKLCSMIKAIFGIQEVQITAQKITNVWKL